MDTTEKIMYIKCRLTDYLRSTCSELGLDEGLTILVMEGVMADLYRTYNDKVLGNLNSVNSNSSSPGATDDSSEQGVNG